MSHNIFHMIIELQNNLQVNQNARVSATAGASNNVRHTRGSLNRSQSQNKEGNGAGNFISSKQLTDTLAKKRSSKKN